MEINNKINDILMEWNPVGVKGKNLENEYERYIEEIIECDKETDCLLELINDIEGNRIGYFYTTSEARLLVVKRILKLFNK